MELRLDTRPDRKFLEKVAKRRQSVYMNDETREKFIRLAERGMKVSQIDGEGFFVTVDTINAFLSRAIAKEFEEVFGGKEE